MKMIGLILEAQDQTSRLLWNRADRPAMDEYLMTIIRGIH